MKDYIFKHVKGTATGGRSNRQGEIKHLPKNHRTIRGLQALSKADPAQEFLVWWELLKSTTESKMINAKAKDDRKIAAATKKTEKEKIQKEMKAKKDTKTKQKGEDKTAAQTTPNQSQRKQKPPLRYA
jgi:hypothetical protein